MPVLILVFSLSGPSVLCEDGQVRTAADVIDVRTFGAKGDGVSDDTGALQKAIEEALKTVGGLKPDVKYEWKGDSYPGYPPVTVYLPRGTYLVKKTIRVGVGSYSWNKAIRIIGEFSRIRAGGKMDVVIHVDTVAHITLQGFSIDGARLAGHGLTAFKISGRDALVERINVAGALSHGIVLEKCQGSVFRNCSADGNGGDGWHIIDCNAALFDGVRAMGNQGNGYTITSKDFSAGCILSNLWSEGNKGHGVEITETVSSQVVIRDGWLEGNGKDGVRVGSAGAYLTGLNIVGGYRDDSREGMPRQRQEYAPIRLTKTAAGCYVVGNQIRGGGLRGGRIYVEGNPEQHYFTGNFRLFRARTVVPAEIDTGETESVKN